MMMKYIDRDSLLRAAQHLAAPTPWLDIPSWAWFECAKWMKPTPENVTKWWAAYQARLAANDGWDL